MFTQKIGPDNLAENFVFSLNVIYTAKTIAYAGSSAQTGTTIPVFLAQCHLAVPVSNNNTAAAKFFQFATLNWFKLVDLFHNDEGLGFKSISIYNIKPFRCMNVALKET